MKAKEPSLSHIAAKRIRELRNQAGLTLEELADLIPGASKQLIHRLESGKTKLTVNWRKIAEAMRASPVDLLDMAMLADPSDDVRTLPIDDHVAAAIATRGLVAYQVTGRSVERAGIKPGDSIAVDQTPAAIGELKTGDIVLARSGHANGDGRDHSLVLRQYVEPGMLVTNRSGPNLAIDLSGPTVTPKIVGVVLQVAPKPK